MSQPPDDARAARIQKYKEERRKQLTARSAVLFSNNVTDRRTKKPLTRSATEQSPLKSSSDLNLHASSAPVPIRTTRTSRLRAAAASSLTESPTRKSATSDDLKAKPRTSRAIERDKPKSTTPRKSSDGKDPRTSSIPKDNGAIRTKPKHSTKNLEKDKKTSHSETRIVDTFKEVAPVNDERTENLQNVMLEVSVVESFDDLLAAERNGTQEEPIEYLFENLVDYYNNGVNEGRPKNDDAFKQIFDDNDSEKINGIVKVPITVEVVNNVVRSRLASEVTDKGGLLGVVCAGKVERFSELLSNLCSPFETDACFENVIAENGINGDAEQLTSPPTTCRRSQPSPRVCSTPKQRMTPPTTAEPANDTNENAKKIKKLNTVTPRPKTENLLPSSKKSKITSPLDKSHPNKSPQTSSSKIQDRRRSSDGGTKPSCIPLARRSIERNRNSASPNKSTCVKKSPEKASSDVECSRYERRHRAQKHSQNVSEKYHRSMKRLTSIERNSKDANSFTTRKLLHDSSVTESDIGSDILSDSVFNTDNVSTLHETLRPHASSSRLTQRMDSLAALTKQTLDRVNKLSNKVNGDTPERSFDAIYASGSEQNNVNQDNKNINERAYSSRGVTERLRDIDTAAQRLIDFEKQSSMFSDLNNDPSSQNAHSDSPVSLSHTPVSILKRKSIHEENVAVSSPHHAIASPPVTFSPNVIETCQLRSENRQRQGILKKRRSLDESQVARRRSCSPEVSFADDGSEDANKPILKNRRSSLEDMVRNRSPDGQIQGILKRKISRDDEISADISNGSPEPQGILKRKSNSSLSSSTTSSHVSIAQAVLLAAAGGAEIVDDDREMVRPILKKKSFSEERPSVDISQSETPKPILKKKSLEHDEYDFDLPKKPILKISRKISGEDGHSSSFDLSEDDRSSRRPSLLKSRTSDHSGSECETTVRPILKQRGSSLTRERSQSPRPRLSFCADSEANTGVTNFSSDANDQPVAGPSRLHNFVVNTEVSTYDFPSAVLRRRHQRPKSDPRSKTLTSEVNEELLSILNNRRLKVDDPCENGKCASYNDLECTQKTLTPKSFPSVAARIKSMEQALTIDPVSYEQSSTSRSRTRDRDRFKTQPITVEEMRSVASNLESGQAGFQAFSPISGSFPSPPVESGAVVSTCAGEQQRDPYGFNLLSSPTYVSKVSTYETTNGYLDDAKDDIYGEANFLDFENGASCLRRQSTLEEIEKEVEKVREELDEESRALDEDERHQAEADTWSLNVSCDSGVYNRASSRDSGPHSGEELGLIESQEIKDNQEANSGSNWSAIEQDLDTMDREQKSIESEDQSLGASDDEKDNGGFALGLVKSNSVVARASMWQQLQQQAKGTPKPLLRHSRSKARDSSSIGDRYKTQPISFNPSPPEPTENFGLAPSKSTANVLDRDEDAKLDEDDPAKMSLMEKMKMFNSKLTHKPPVAGLPKPKEDRMPRASRRTMPVLASQVQEALDNNERLSKSLIQEEMPRNPDFQLKMELFRSASARNTSLEYMMRENAKFRSLDLDDEPSPHQTHLDNSEVRGILKSALPPRPKALAKGESSEGLKDEGIDSSSDDDSTSSVSSTSCSSSESSDELPGSKPRRFQTRKNKLIPSRTDSDLTQLKTDPRKIQMPGATELQQRLTQAKNLDIKPPMLAKIRRPSEEHKDEVRVPKKLDEPLQLGKLRRNSEKLPPQPAEPKSPVMKISNLSQEAKNKFFGLDTKQRTIEELTAAVRKYIPPVSKSVSVHSMEVPGSGSDGESSGGREVRYINSKVRRGGGGLQKSATHAEMPHRGGTIAERLAALQAAGANDWRARVCRLSPERDDTKAIERAKNQINDNLNAVVDDKKKVHIEDTELGSNILADRRNKLETASQGWRKRVPQNDANLFTVAGRLERDKVITSNSPPLPTPPPVPTVPALAPGIPTPNKFRSRKQNSPTNGFASGPLRSASCAVVSSVLNEKPKQDLPIKVDRESFKRSHSVSENISRADENTETSGAEKSGSTVRVPRADDETFQAFFTPVLEKQGQAANAEVDVDLDAIDAGSRQLLASDWARRAKRERRQAGSRNPLRALAARTDIREEYTPAPNTIREQYIKEKVTANCGLAAEALAALATKEDFSNVALRSATASSPPPQGTKPVMLLHVKGRRKVQTRLVEPVYTNVNRGDCFILVTSDQLFLYIGLYANVIERNRSTDIALHIQNTKDLGCKNSPSIITLDEQTKNFTNKHWTQFWTLLGSETSDYKPVDAGQTDEDEIYESCIVQTNMCYEVIDDELVPMKEYWGQTPKIAMLHQSKIIVFDFGSEMYIWYGKNVPLESRRRAAQLAQELFDDGYNYEDCHVNPLNAAVCQGARTDVPNLTKTSKSRPEWAIISKVTQHMESILFKEKFIDWPDYTRVIKVKPQENKTNSTEITPCDAELMWSNDYQEPDLVLEGSHIGRGTHYYDKETLRHFDIRTKSVCKWVIQEYEYSKVESDTELGDFFSGDSYIIRWEYQINATGRELNGKPSKHNLTGRDRCAYFCWQGRDASSNEKGTAALLTVELDKEKGPQIRVAQGSEPPAFLNLFQGNLTIHNGKKDVDTSRYKLFVTRGNLSNEAYLLQVPCSVRQLRSRGSLLLVDTEKGCLHIWHGLRSMKHTKNIAIELANKLIARKCSYLFGENVSNIKINEVKEGEEPKEFLEALGGNKQYYNSVLSGNKEQGVDVTPRLFHFTDLGGHFEAQEVLSPLRHEHLVTPFPFEQKELYTASQPALFLLDDGKAVWLWQGWWPRGEDGELEPAERNTGVGAFAARWQSMRAAALRTAEAYWQVSRNTRPDVRVVTAGLEPQPFMELFDTWVEHDDAAEANIAHGYKSGEVLSGRCELSRLTRADAVVPLAALQRRPLPDHVDPHHLERHLSSPDFLEAFGISKEEFSTLPAWKQTNMKKEVGLF